MQFVSDSLVYIVLSRPWCDMTVLDIHALNEYKTDNKKDGFCECSNGSLSTISALH
jgi:hypothetical protein